MSSGYLGSMDLPDFDGARGGELRTEISDVQRSNSRRNRELRFGAARALLLVLLRVPAPIGRGQVLWGANS